MNNKAFLLIIIVGISILYTGCTDGGLSEISGLKYFKPDKDISDQILNIDDYRSWILNPENGIKKQKNIGEYSFKLQYKPIPFIAALESKNTNEDISVIYSGMKENKLLEFTFAMGLQNAKGELIKHKLTSYEEYDERVKYLAFEAQKDFVIVQNDDSIPCILYHFERTFDIIPFNTFSLGFETTRINLEEEFTLIFDERIFNVGLIQFTYPGGVLNNLPKLKELNT